MTAKQTDSSKEELIDYPEGKIQIELLKQLEIEAWDAPPRYLTYAGTSLNAALGSWDEGILFLSAMENRGKSSFLVQTFTDVLDLNDDALLIDFSLDDSFRERTRRYISCLSNVPTDKVARPINATPEEQERRKRGVKRLAQWMSKEKLIIKTSTEFNINAHSISTFLKEVRDRHPNKKIIVLIDAFNDLPLPDGKGDEPEKLLLLELGKAFKENRAICAMTAHRRKTYTDSYNRRVNNDELKGSGYIKHAAKIIMMLDNEVKARRESAEVYWCPEDSPYTKLPVLEVSVQKNKTCAWDGWIFYKFLPSSGKSWEVEPSEHSYYQNLIIESSKPRYR
jgi:hypothetical protein